MYNGKKKHFSRDSNYIATTNLGWPLIFIKTKRELQSWFYNWRCLFRDSQEHSVMLDALASISFLPEVAPQISLNKNIAYGSMYNFKIRSDTKILNRSCKFLIFKTKEQPHFFSYGWRLTFLFLCYHARHLQQIFEITFFSRTNNKPLMVSVTIPQNTNSFLH